MLIHVMMKDYKVEKFKEGRWRIVNAENGEVLDDAQGYGYKTPRNAHAAWGFKNRDKSKDEEKYKKRLRAWKFLEDDKKLLRRLEDESWWALKDGEEFTANDIKRVIEELTIETDIPLGDIWGAWMHGKPKRYK